MRWLTFCHAVQALQGNRKQRSLFLVAAFANRVFTVIKQSLVEIV
jgi:hypothetical protein